MTGPLRFAFGLVLLVLFAIAMRGRPAPSVCIGHVLVLAGRCP